MKPYSACHLTDAERIFNYKLSQARRIVENAFGILANRFQCLLTTLQLAPQSVLILVMACMCLHNLMWIRYLGLQNVALDCEAVDHQVIRGAWRDGVLIDVHSMMGPTQATRQAKRQSLLETLLQQLWSSTMAERHDLIAFCKCTYWIIN